MALHFENRSDCRQSHYIVECLVTLCSCPRPDGVMWTDICESDWERTRVWSVLAAAPLSFESSLWSCHRTTTELSAQTAARRGAPRPWCVSCPLTAVMENHAVCVPSSPCWATWAHVQCWLKFPESPNNLRPRHQRAGARPRGSVRPTLCRRKIISLQSHAVETAAVYFYRCGFFPSSQVVSLKSGLVWNHLIFISLSSLLIFSLCACHAFLTNPLSGLCDVLLQWTSKGPPHPPPPLPSLCLSHSFAFSSFFSILKP